MLPYFRPFPGARLSCPRCDRWFVDGEPDCTCLLDTDPADCPDCRDRDDFEQRLALTRALPPEEALELAMWAGDVDILDAISGCNCCCWEHTYSHCTARLWNGCRSGRPYGEGDPYDDYRRAFPDLAWDSYDQDTAA